MSELNEETVKTHSKAGALQAQVDNPDKAATDFARMIGDQKSVVDNNANQGVTDSAGSSRVGTPGASNASMQDMLVYLSENDVKSEQEITELGRKKAKFMEQTKDDVDVRV